MPQMVHLRKYGVATSIDFSLFEIDGVDLRVDAVYAAGDVKIMKDEGAEANVASGFVDEGSTYSQPLAEAEMQAARIVLVLIDQTAPKAWLDDTIIIETYGNASAMHAFDLDNATGTGLTAIPWNAAWDTEVESEVTDSLVAHNLDHLALTATAAADMTAEVADNTILSRILANGDTSAFAPSTDGLQLIRDAITDANPMSHAATANNETTGTLDAGTYADTETVNTTYYQTSPVDPAVGGFGLNVDLTFGVGTGRVPSTVLVTGYFDSGAQRTVQVWAYNYITAAYVQLSNSATDFGNAAANQSFQYSLTANMVQIADGEVKIRFTSTSITAADDFYCDSVIVNSVAQEAAGLTADQIQTAVWARADSGHDENTLGYNVSKLFLAKGHVVAVTSASQFTMDNGVAIDNAYNGMLMLCEDKTDDHYEIRRIVDYVGATKEVFLDRAFGFTPVAEDDCYLLGHGYADTNITHVAGTAQTGLDLGGTVTEARLAELDAANLPADVAAVPDAAEINAEVVDVVATDTYAEPGQEAPAATNTLAVKIGYIFKFLRNKIITDATSIEVYNDAGSVVDQKSTISDDGTDFTRGEFGSGP